VSDSLHTRSIIRSLTPFFTSPRHRHLLRHSPISDPILQSLPFHYYLSHLIISLKVESNPSYAVTTVRQKQPAKPSSSKTASTSKTTTKSKGKNPSRRRESIRVTRTQIRQPRTDEEFIAEYSQYPVAEQNRRISLIGNISRDEAERRLLLLGRKHEELERVLNVFDQDAFTKLQALGDTENKDYYSYYEEVAEPENPVVPTFEDIYPVLDDEEEEEAYYEPDNEVRDNGTENNGKMSGAGSTSRQHTQGNSGGSGRETPIDNDNDIPEWARTIMQQQQRQLDKLTRLVENRGGHYEGRPVKADEIYAFMPDDSKTGIDYFLFAERIADMVNVHGEDKILPSLISCLKNDMSKEWYSLLSDEDKERLRTSAEAWMEILKRDFGIKPSIARQKANRENFYFSQGRRVLDYFHKKVTWLKISGIDDEDSVCMEVRDGLRDPEYRALVRVGDGITLAKLRSDLTEVENDAKALWMRNQQNSTTFARRQPGQFDRGSQRGRGYSASFNRGGGNGRDQFQGQSQARSAYSTQNQNSSAQSTSSRSSYQDPSKSGQNSLNTNRYNQRGPRPALTANDSTNPPRPCRFCGLMHWDKDCPQYNPRVYHFEYDEDYERAQEEALFYNFGTADHYDDSVVAYDEENQAVDDFYSGDYRDDDSIPQYHLQAPSNVSPASSSHGKSISRLSFKRNDITPSIQSSPSQPTYSSKSPSTRSSPSSRSPPGHRPYSRNAHASTETSTQPPPSPSAQPNSSPLKAQPSTATPQGSSEDVGGPVFTHNFTTLSKPTHCEMCKKEFPSRNQLFHHLEKEGHKTKKPSSTPVEVIPSTAPKGRVGTGLAYRDYTYAEIKYQTSVDGPSQWGCLDTGGPMSCIDMEILTSLPWTDRRFTPPVDIEIRGVAGKTRSTESVVLNVYLPDVSGTKYALITGEFHVVENLDCGILFGEDIIETNGFVIDSQRGRARIRSCQNMECLLKVKRVKAIEEVPVRSNSKFVIPGKSTAAIPLRMPKVAKADVDYTIHPYTHNRWLPIGCYLMSGIIKGNQEKVFITNISDLPATISKGTRIGTISSLSCADCPSHWEEASREVSIHLNYTDESTTNDTVIDDFFDSSDIYSFQVGTTSSSSSITSSIIFDNIKSYFTAKPESTQFRADLVTINPNLSDEQQKAFRQLLRKHEPLFSEKLGLAKEPEEDHLRVPLYPGAEEKIRPMQPYRLSPQERKVVDETFDRLRAEGRLVDAPPSPCGWQVFVVKRGNKWRPVVDLRPLNAITIPDAYPLPLQEEIISCIRGHPLISLLDKATAYYQRSVWKGDRWKLCIVTHRGHEMFNVAPMGHINSVAHQQKYMDKLLARFKWRIAMCYLDDIVVFSISFDQHLIDLDEVLTVLEEAGLTLSPHKCMVGFGSIKLLGKVVDSFGLATTEERTAAIVQQQWPENLQLLDTFLGQCGFVRDHIPYFAKITTPLYRLKTQLFKPCPITKGRQARKHWAKGIKLPPPTTAQKKSFELTKQAVGKWILMHHSYEKPYIMYIDGSREVGYGVAVFQYKDDRKEVPAVIDHSEIRPVMFLSRELKAAEEAYWPTELEVGGLVWALQKLRHIVQSSYCVVYTDHKASETIAKMKGLKTTSPGRKNLRLANWSLFLSQFWGNLDVRYCKGIENVMADGLSRLRREVIELTDEDKLAIQLREKREQDDSDDIHVYNVDEVVAATLVQLEDEFKSKLVSAYKSDSHFGPIYKILEQQRDSDVSRLQATTASTTTSTALSTSTDSNYHQAPNEYQPSLPIRTSITSESAQNLVPLLPNSRIASGTPSTLRNVPHFPPDHDPRSFSLGSDPNSSITVFAVTRSKDRNDGSRNSYMDRAKDLQGSDEEKIPEGVENIDANDGSIQGTDGAHVSADKGTRADTNERNMDMNEGVDRAHVSVDKETRADTNERNMDMNEGTDRAHVSVDKETRADTNEKNMDIRATEGLDISSESTTTMVANTSSDFVSRPGSSYNLSISTGLLYYQDSNDNRYRLCVPRMYLKEVLALAHDADGHFGISKTYSRLVSGFFAPRLLKQVKLYIKYCPRCAINKIVYDKPHGELQPIRTPPEPLHTLTMDFIVGLPTTTLFGHGEELFDCILSITCKFSKVVRLLIGKTTYGAAEWANCYWTHIYPDWGLPHSIISDRDPKFLSQFWKQLFQRAGTKLLVSTAYHPQSDGQSEKTNQTVEIILRHYIAAHQKDWPEHLPAVQAAINTSVSKSTKYTPLQLLYGITPRHALDFFKGSISNSNVSADLWSQARTMMRQDAADSIAHAQEEMKRFKDLKQTPISFSVGDQVYLRLATGKNSSGYTLPSTIKPKISQQRAGPFKVLECVGKNACRLLFPVTWRIHDVISVVYLDPAPKGKDPFDRDVPPPPPVVKNAEDPDAEWEVEAVVNKRIRKTGRAMKVQYLVRYSGWGPDYDEWRSEEELSTCAELVEEYEKAMGNITWTPPEV